MIERKDTIRADFAVIGGGMAGLCAAVSAARQGSKVVLVQNRPVLGGNSSSEIRVWVCGATAHGNQRWARETGIIGELLEENQYRNPDGNPIYWDQLLFDVVRREKNIRLLLNTDIREVGMDADATNVQYVRGWTMGSERIVTIYAQYFADCTGDGWLGATAGLDYRLGQESRDEFGESWAPARSRREFLGSTILFYTKDAGRPVPFVAPDSAVDIRETPIIRTRTLKAGDKGTAYWWIEYGGRLNPVEDNEEIAAELRDIVFGIWDFIKNSGEFEAGNMTLEWVGAIPGKREYRRFKGAYTLTQDDVMSQSAFDDAIGFGGWSIDLHPSDGVYSDSPGALQRFSDGLFQIPFRCLFSTQVENLVFAGRNISATHVAFGATRVMATCSVMGEAIGTAVAIALEGPESLTDLARDPGHLQRRLLREDASLFGVPYRDPDDLVQRAAVTSSGDCREWSLDPGDAPTWCALDREHAFTVPGDVRIDELHVFGHGGGRADVSVMSGSHPGSVVPNGSEVTRGYVDLPSDPGWARVVFDQSVRGAVEADLFVVFAGTSEQFLARTAQASSLGISLVHAVDADDQNVEVAPSPLLEWSSRMFTNGSLVYRLVGASERCAAASVQGGYQRPYGGPNMWVSGPLAQGPAELSAMWDEPVTVGWVDLVFDTQPDVELNNLHHHRTPYRTFPSLVRDFCVVGRYADGSEQVFAEVRENRRRHVRIDLGVEELSSLTVRVLSTHGAPEARIVALRAYRPEVPGADVSHAHRAEETQHAQR